MHKVTCVRLNRESGPKSITKKKKKKKTALNIIKVSLPSLSYMHWFKTDAKEI